MNTFESDVAHLNTGHRIREANRQRLGPTEGGWDQQVSDLNRLCFRHWLYLMLASLLDAPDPETGIDQLGSTRMDVMRAALSCPRCRARNGLYPPPAAPGGMEYPRSDGWTDPPSPYELLDQRADRGRFVPIRRIIAGVVTVAVGVAGIAMLGHRPAELPTPGGVDITTLAVGDCVRDMASSGEFAREVVDVVDCARPHTDEVYATFPLRDGSYPGDHQVETLAGHGCDKRFAAYVGTSPARTTLEMYLITPTQEAWSLDHDQVVLCTVSSPGHPTKGSVRHSGR